MKMQKTAIAKILLSLTFVVILFFAGSQVAEAGFCSVDHLKQFWPDDAENASIVCMGESGGDPRAENLDDFHPTGPCRGSFGLFQLACFRGTTEELKDPETNIRLAVELYESKGNTFCDDWGAAKKLLPECGGSGGNPDTGPGPTSGGSSGTITVGGPKSPLDPSTGQPVELGPINCNVDWPTIPLPGRNFSLNDICEGNVNPSVGQIVVFIYGAALWISGVAAFVTLVYAGFLYIFSGASPNLQGKAKTYIKNVVWGLAILLLSFVTLQLINPDITELQFTNPQEVRVCQDAEETNCISRPLTPSKRTGGRFGNTPVVEEGDVEDEYPLCPEITGEGTFDTASPEAAQCMQENYGAIRVRDDSEAQASCLGACMLTLGDPLSCRNIGAADDGIPYDPHHAWLDMHGANPDQQFSGCSEEVWSLDGECGSPHDRDFSSYTFFPDGPFGESGSKKVSNEKGRACTIQYLETAINTEADTDFCICSDPQDFADKSCEDFGSCEPTSAE